MQKETDMVIAPPFNFTENIAVMTHFMIVDTHS